jgi:hypothetical protein
MAGQSHPSCRCDRPLPYVQRSSVRKRPGCFVDLSFSAVRRWTGRDPQPTSRPPGSGHRNLRKQTFLNAGHHNSPQARTI